MGNGSCWMKTIAISPAALADTFTLIARPDTHIFLDRDLPEYVGNLGRGAVPLSRYIDRLRSGDYIPKAAYADRETEFVYLTIGQFSGTEVVFEDLTYLDPTVGETYTHLAVGDGDLVVTRSGTVGVVHEFKAPDEKVYIPSHHLAIAQVAAGKPGVEYLRLVLQSEFARRYFWSFASGKGQKEISNWSIKTVPIPVAEDPQRVADKMTALEQEIQQLRSKVETTETEKQRVLEDAVGANQ
jgi:hypothetical protein